MPIAIDQSKLRRLTTQILRGESLRRSDAAVIVLLVQLAGGADDDEAQDEYAVVQSIAQHLSTLVGGKPGEMIMATSSNVGVSRSSFVRELSASLTRGAARELAYVLVFAVVVADLRLLPSERGYLEELQSALELDDRQATNLTITVTDLIAA